MYFINLPVAAREIWKSLGEGEVSAFPNKAATNIALPEDQANEGATTFIGSK